MVTELQTPLWLSHVAKSYCPDIVIYNEAHRKIQLLELTCLFYTTKHLQAALEHKPEYQLLSPKLGYCTLYLTIEIGCLGHFLFPSVRALQAATEQSLQQLVLNKAPQKAICSLQHIISACDCPEWNTTLYFS